MIIEEDWLNILTGKYACPNCGKEYSKKGIGTHIWRMHGDGKDFKPSLGNTPWNKGLTKEYDNRVAHSNETKVLLSEKHRGKNSEETKRKISDGMKRAHNEGRAWNIGQSRWNNEMSYPEKFFKQVIENEFDDKNFKQEYSVGIYSIDFAWVNKKIAIEIDGAQHEKPDYKARDKRKDKKLSDEGWDILRIKWKDMFNDTKYWITEANSFVGIEI